VVAIVQGRAGSAARFMELRDFFGEQRSGRKRLIRFDNARAKELSDEFQLV
jgi:hypothetical protein